MNNLLSLLQLYSEWGVDETIAPVCTNSLQTVKQITPPIKAKPLPKTFFNPHSYSFSNINTIKELKQTIVNSKENSLHSTAMNTILPEGNDQSPFFIVGEIPDADEDRNGKIFYGKTEKWLLQLFNTIDINFKDCFRMPLIPWRPPGERALSKQELESCTPFLFKAIEICQPKLVITLGLLPVRFLTKSTASLSQLSGKLHVFSLPDISHQFHLFSLRHPLQLSTSSKIKQKTWEDLLKLKKIIADLSTL